MKITVYGASDDLIEVDGDIREEWCDTEGGGYLLFSDGMVLTVMFSESGLWHVGLLKPGKGSFKKVRQADHSDDVTMKGPPSYSDHVEVEGDYEWIAYTKSIAKPK